VGLRGYPESPTRGFSLDDGETVGSKGFIRLLKSASCEPLSQGEDVEHGPKSCKEEEGKGNKAQDIERAACHG